MPAANFATLSKTCPNPYTTTHLVGGGATPYTCHMAVMHWAFMDLGDTSATANARIQAIIQAKCMGCTAGFHLHASIQDTWYGANLCGGAVTIANRAALYPAVAVGDVLITDHSQRPAHSMVMVSRNSMMTRKYVNIRGFNNLGTLGTGTFLNYDHADRDIDKGQYWSAAGFGNAKVALHRIPYATYAAAAAIVRNNCNNAAGNWVYIGL